MIDSQTGMAHDFEQEYIYVIRSQSLLSACYKRLHKTVIPSLAIFNDYRVSKLKIRYRIYAFHIDISLALTNTYVCSAFERILAVF